MRFAELAAVSEQLAATSKRGEKSALIAALLRRLAPDEIEIAVAFLTGSARQGRIGVGWRTLQAARTEPAVEPTLEIDEVDAAIDQLAGMSGPGVGAARRNVLTDLFGRATRAEQDLLWRIFTGEMRQGALDGVMVEAIAKGSGVPIADVRRAHMMAGDLGAGGAGRADGGRRGRRRGRPRAGAGGAADARLARRRRGRRGGRHGAGVRRVEARRRPHPGSSPRRAASRCTPAT